MDQGLFEAPMERSGLLARVVLERGIDHPEGLTYWVPRALADLLPGDRVVAPLGKANREVEGYVLALAEENDPASLPDQQARLKPLLRRSSPGRSDPGDVEPTRLTPDLINLATWMAQYYCCPIGMVLASMLPAAVKRNTGGRSIVVLVRASPDAVQLEQAKLAVRTAWDRVLALEASRFPIAPRELAVAIGADTLRPINALVRAGLLLERRIEEVKGRGAAGWDAAAEPDVPPSLTSTQSAAVDSVSQCLGSFRAFLLWGVTGSGKTEVYLRILARTLARGSGAIVLVPEISLTPQTAGRFLARFGGADGPGVAVLHSGLSGTQRHREWLRVARGEARIVIGARSAIFAPMRATLGVIIVDEEHDSSYKQDQLPRYHGRDVALRRGQLAGCPVILGSATPSLESWHNALPIDQGGAGRFGLLTLPERVGGGALPRVAIVDMVEERRQRRDRHQHAIGIHLEHELRRTLAGAGQAILLLNRRGFASYICCADAGCGWYMMCRHCDITVVYHREKRAAGGGHGGGGELLRIVKCHHCLAEQKLPAQCPMCGKAVNFFGAGTQRVEEELARLFPELKLGETLLRLDADSMRRAADYFEALERFRTGAARVMLGTQMIAKGLDFPAVELIGVINADTALGLPDFRAAERTFQLVSQVAGRAGRSAASRDAARVIVQTMCPKEAAIRLAATHDYRAFAELELDCRRDAGLPPIGRMARIVCRDTNADKAVRRAREIAIAAHRTEDDLIVKGPMECPIARIGDHYRFAVELLAKRAAVIQATLTRLRGEGLVKSDAHTAVDVDPVALL